ncbi:3'-5' exonuclease [Thermoactinomyces sp. DSM 45892]|uniref:3'-5' exonuclease n=1 Tax=Thermoactinomyces sp. DSM 45892 TaxID=1882753 RepID=UPI0008966343|nr:3'-5' exonuclease [Thermoactinomyces sp. DSM 45892]SDY88771.1 DNA polymerase-3 subunit epsilon [Thermoactinomyces sp. DSM 45892]
MENKQEYVILDTETTDLNNAEILEISVINLDGHTLYNSLARPVNSISQGSMKIHGINYEMVKDAPTWLEVWEELYPLIKDKIILIYNSDFDLRVIRSSFYPYKVDYSDERYKNTYGLKSECVMKTYASLRNSSWIKLEVACGYKTKHRATSDCLATLDVIKNTYDPSYTKVDLKRSQFYKQYLDHTGDIKTCGNT